MSEEIAIVVADRGHVWVGAVTTGERWCEIKGASAVRVWGTTRGLGQLAAEGPLSGTKLDPVNLVRVNMRAVIAVIPCKAGKWKS